tara:strand:+ start:616 stop:1287 length:672 start_codon:yes stop_codon:yes gene_type:complete
MIKTELGDIQLLQPWSTFVMKLKMSDSLIKTALKMTNDALIEKNKPYGKSLAGQIDEEWGLMDKFLSEEYLNLKNYITQASTQYTIMANVQNNSNIEDNNLPNTTISEIWSVHQYDNEYNPIHLHTAQISGVFYLKIPEYLPTKKQHQEHDTDDGSIVFINNSAGNNGMGGLIPWGNKSYLKVNPQVGDFYLFPACMYHTVYPFRTETGKEERRSVSFNVFIN